MVQVNSAPIQVAFRFTAQHSTQIHSLDGEDDTK